MKRFHVHIGVEDIEQSVAFYSHMFGRAPAKQRDDYAKWMLDDPRVNFAISTRASRAAIGFDHFGMQVDSAEELAELRAAAENATGGQLLDEGATTCCYSSSEKHWTLDPQGIAWEHFHTLDDAPTYHGDQSGDCCIPIRSAPEDNCCVPVESNSEAPGCCG